MTVAKTLLLVALLAPAAAARADPSAGAEPPGLHMDYGPFLTGSLDRDKAVSEKNSTQSTEQDGPNPNALAAKAVCVKLGGDAAVAFDTDLLRYAAGWTGGFVDLEKTHLATPKGSTPLAPAGTLRFSTGPRLGWSLDREFPDPRPRPFGPLPRAIGRYLGLYTHGDRVVFSYTVDGCNVLETPTFEQRRAGNGTVQFSFYRTFHITPVARTLWVLLRENDAAQAEPVAAVLAFRPKTAGGRRVPEEVSLFNEPKRSLLKIDPCDHDRVFTTLLSGPVGENEHTVAAADPADPAALIAGGLARYKPLETRGSLGTGNGAYVVDTLTLPDDNPWKSWMRPSGLDFFSDGRLAVCTLNGDVWVVSGIDDKLEKLSWRRFATGLYEPLGLRIVKDQIYVLGRDQITRLHDLNGDGEADFYENFNNDAPCSANYHGFAFDLDIDSKGNFYYIRAGQRMSPELPMAGALLRGSPDGSKLEPVAAGLRAANGLCVGPGDLITVADNQGNWVPSSRINLIRPGGFYGWMPHVRAAGGPPRTDYDPPLCWIPMSVDNSGGSQVWATDPRFGPLAGQMLYTSYGHASLMLVMTQKLPDGAYQGGVVKLPFRFDSGVMRARINPRDGQLYVCGLRGWQTDGTRDGTVARVRYTGNPLYMPTGFRVVPAGIALTFSQPLDPKTAEDTGSFAAEQWNYLWSEKYGSDDWSAQDPKRKGHDPVTIESARLSADRRTVMLTVPNLGPVMQMQIDVDVDAADGTNIKDTLWLTINEVAPGIGH